MVRDRDTMTSIREIPLLLFLLLHKVNTEEPDPTFRPEGGVTEMGYCFGVDYIVVYRSAPEGDQLLANSSADVTPPADLQGRISINQQLLGVQISHLKHSDSGIYRWECWQNKTLANLHKRQLSVCNDERNPSVIPVKEDGGAELLCNRSSIGLEGTTIRWYHEVVNSVKATLFLDSNMSLEPLLQELQGIVEVRDGGALLHVPSRVLENSHNFYCLVMKGENCLSVQYMYMHYRDDVRDIFTSKGDRVTLKCPSDHKNQQWETPLGKINTTTESLTSTEGSVESDQIHISGGDESENYSLVIPAISDQHSGKYLCFSPSLVAEYDVVICPKQDAREKKGFEGGDVLLECELTPDKSHSVQWLWHGSMGEDRLIQDSNDKSIPIPEDLRGRVSLSENGSSLTLSGLTVKDVGVYWCVVLGGPEFLKSVDDYPDDDEEDYSEEYEDEYRCISKQETLLTVILSKDKGRGLYLVPSDLPNNPTPDPPADSSVTAYALGAGLVGLLVAAVIAAVIVIKKKAKAKAASGSGLNVKSNTDMNVDPSCAERLNPKDECDA